MCDPVNDFYFAASSINITFFMKKYFHLLDHLTPTNDKSVQTHIIMIGVLFKVSLKEFLSFLGQRG